MSKKISFTLLLLSLLFVNPIMANTNYKYNECFSCCNNSQWGLYADWLYWRARRCETDYAVPYDTSSDPADQSIGNVSCVTPTYTSGYRIGLFYECNNILSDIYYTHFHSKDSDDVMQPNGRLAGTRLTTPNNAFVSPGDMQFARGKLSIDYDTVDALVGSYISSCSCIQPYFLGGFKYAGIDQEIVTFYEQNAAAPGPVDLIRQKIDMNAYGVDLGLGATTTILSCLDFFGRFSFDILLGDFKRTFDQSSGQSGVADTQVHDLAENDWCMVTAINLWFGLQYFYNIDCLCTRVGLSVGYEFHQYFGMPDFLDYISVNSNLVTFDRHTQAFGLDGLFLRLSLEF